MRSMPRIITKIGDVFSAQLGEKTKKYFQYVANDLTQLNSDVIRAFKKTYSLEENTDLSVLVNDEVDFYAHCVTKWGIKLGYWEKVGNVADVGRVNVLFRNTSDWGPKAGEQVKVSHRWWIWKINQEHKYVGKLEGENQKAEIGIVISPDSIVHRIKTGRYDFVYPEYE